MIAFLRRRSSVHVMSLAFAIFGLSSCGGSSSSTTVGPLAKITVTPSTASISNGQQETFFAAPVDASGNTVNGETITWTSSATNIATIDANGVAIGKSPGISQITASAAGITSNSVALTVTATVAQVVLTPLSASTTVNGTQQFSAKALDSSGNELTGVSISWFCSFSGIATIDQNGLAKGVAPGTVTIVASAGSVNSQPATLTVN